MVERSTSDFFDRYARDFAAIYGTANTPWSRVVNKLFRRSMRLRFEMSVAGCDPIAGRTAIDVGCGPGHFSVALAERGARQVLGLDFAESMVDLARQRAVDNGVSDRCRFEVADVFAYPLTDRFDYAIVMGFMDYMSDPQALVDKILGCTARRAFFSFPAKGGLLAWQRRLRYRRRCDLFLYAREDIERLFSAASDEGVGVTIERIDRDYFVTATRREA